MNDRVREIVPAAAVAAALCGSLHALLHPYGIDLSDGGFLWYGAQQTALGHTPLLDFQSYDPGRYVWTALLMRGLGSDGFLTVLRAAVLFQTGAIFAALLTLRRSGVGWDVSLPGVGLLAVWMFPDFRYYDHGLSILLVCAATALLARPSARGAFAFGVVVGLAAYFGRNHGVYGLVGGLGAVVLTRFSDERTPLLHLLAGLGLGVGVGYLPMLFHMVARPGFVAALLDSVVLTFERGSTNLPLATPWPWRVETEGLPAFLVAGHFTAGLWFLALACAPLACLGLFARFARYRSVPPLLLASALYVPVYAHYAFSRADLAHLSSGVMPLLLLAIGAAGLWLTGARRAAALATLVLLSLPTLAIEPYRMLAFTAGTPLEPVVVDGNTYEVDAFTAEMLRATRLLDRGRFAGDALLAAPFVPGLYAVTRKSSPTWQIYFLAPVGAEREQAEIERMEHANVRWAILADLPLDGRDALRLSRSQPRITSWVEQRFELQPHAGLPRPYHLYVRRDP
jgi:hypothetical protein